LDKQTLVDALVKADSARPRSLQTAIGVSQLGGCRRQVWHKSRGDAETNDTLRLPAIMGTAIHTAIEAALNIPGALIEHRVELDGLPPATIDFFDPTKGEVVDWKTITLKNVAYFVTQQKRWQVQTYGYLMEKAGHQVNTVTLVGIPRDGTENDIVVYSEPYDPAVAEQALAWLADVTSREEAPSPERDAASFCAKYCPFYGSACQGIGKDMTGDAIVDEVAELAAWQYKKINEEIKKLEAEKDAAKAALEGVNGVTLDGIRVRWSEVAGRQSPDTEEIVKLLGSVPTRQGAPSLRLEVK
jgi:Domain of unknown function DUF83